MATLLVYGISLHRIKKLIESLVESDHFSEMP